MSGLRFRHTHRVTYADCAPGNHVYYGRYLEFLEAARGELFRHVGVPFQRWQEQNAIFPVVECHLRYKAPARYDDLLSIELWVIRAGPVRLSLGARIRNEAGTVILDAETTHVSTALNEKLQRLPHGLVSALQPYLAPGLGKKSPESTG